MSFPVDITYRNMNESLELKRLIDQKVEALGRKYTNISSCRITFEGTEGKEVRKQSYFSVRIDVQLPGKPPIMVSRDAGRSKLYPSMTKLISEAFLALQKQLEKIHSQQHKHEKSLKGQIYNE